MSTIRQYLVEMNLPFDLDVTVDSWIYADIQPTPEMKHPREFGRCFLLKGQQVPVWVVQLRKGNRPRLEVQWLEKHDRHRETILSLMKWLLGWDVDTRPILTEMRADSVIAHLVKPLQGLRPFSQPSFFEAIVKAILQQQISYRSANQVIRTLVLQYGAKCCLGDATLYGFPTLENLCRLSETDLRACKIGFKAPYLMELCEHIVNGSLQLDVLATRDSKIVLQKLDGLRGIGQWTAELAVLTGLRRFDVFPSGDLGIRNIISQLYLGNKPALREDVEKIAERWGKARTLVLYFLMCAQVLGLV